MQRPLLFKIGDGKAIRGLEEVLRTMSLGERVQVTIDSKWGYKKGGLQDEEGKYVIPPNASLIFDMQLVRLNHHEFVKKGKKNKSLPNSPHLSGLSGPHSGFSSPRSSPASTPPSSPGLKASPGMTPPHSPAFSPTGGAPLSPRSPKMRGADTMPPPSSPKSPLSQGLSSPKGYPDSRGHTKDAPPKAFHLTEPAIPIA